MVEYMEENNNGYRIKDARLLPPLVLAYIGDSVFELFIREKLVSSGIKNVHNLHRKTITYVRAKAQSFMVHELLDTLSHDEAEVVRRGRNANSHTVPKNADISDYRYATGFESLIGFLYLTNQTERMNYILESAFELMNKEKNLDEHK